MRRIIMAAAGCLLLLAWPSPSARAAGTGEAGAALTEALVVGAQRVIAQLGRPDGFLKDPKVRIPLPGPLESARPTLGLVGLGGLADDLELRINRAAEEATPIAGDMLIRAIRGLSFGDAVGILRGPKDSATRYLERQTEEPLAQKMRPIVDKQLAEAGAVRVFDNIAGRWSSLPLVSGLKADLGGHVVTFTERAIFDRLAVEEGRIRADPAARTTDLLRAVFGR